TSPEEFLQPLIFRRTPEESIVRVFRVKRESLFLPGLIVPPCVRQPRVPMWRDRPEAGHGCFHGGSVEADERRATLVHPEEAARGGTLPPNFEIGRETDVARTHEGLRFSRPGLPRAFEVRMPRHSREFLSPDPLHRRSVDPDFAALDDEVAI